MLPFFFYRDSRKAFSLKIGVIATAPKRLMRKLSGKEFRQKKAKEGWIGG
jgi:hypothetical protein